jgi:RNA polymerase sigma-70 factor (ECF subfamily)
VTDAVVREMWDSFRGHIRSYLRRRVRNPADVEELVQEVFLRIHQRLGTVRSSERLEAWIHRIARNVLIDHYRSAAARSARERSPAALDLHSREDGDPELPRAGLTRCLSPMVDRLEQKYRDAISLVEIRGLGHAEAATRLGVSLSGMKSRVQRGRGKLKAMLLECCHVELDRRGGIVQYMPRSPCDCAGPGSSRAGGSRKSC